jgi:hypothetical protein
MKKKDKDYKEWIESVGLLDDNRVVIMRGEKSHGMSLVGAYLVYCQRKLFPNATKTDAKEYEDYCEGKRSCL